MLVASMDGSPCWVMCGAWANAVAATPARIIKERGRIGVGGDGRMMGAGNENCNGGNTTGGKRERGSGKRGTAVAGSGKGKREAGSGKRNHLSFRAQRGTEDMRRRRSSEVGCRRM